jgi:hypothetical protein
MNTKSLDWFAHSLPAPRAQVVPAAIKGLLARVWQALAHAANHPSGVSPDVLALFEQADRYDATQPGYAADLRAAAVRALRARHGAS